MPKKKEKTGSDKQDGDKKTQKKFSPSDKTGPDDKEKDLYLIQIGYLQEQLERYQLKSDELERQKKDLQAQYSTLEKEKKDIVEFLKRSLLEKEDEVDALTERLESQRQAAEKEQDAAQLQQNQLRQELQGRIEELTKENAMLGAQLASLEEFQKQKEQLVSNMESLERQLASQKDEHKTDVHNLEMKALLEKRRLEKEMESHVAAMAEEVQHLVNQNLPEATRMALQENTEMKVQLSQLSEQAQALMKENSALQERKSKLSLDVDILEKMLSEMTRQSCSLKKVLEQLTEKCQLLQAEQKGNRQELKQLQSEHKGTQAELETLRQEQASLSEQHSKSRAEVRRLEAELQEEKRKRSRIKSIMREAAATIRQTLMKTPTEQESVTQWKKLMQKLLVVLTGPTSSNTEDEQLNERQTSDPGAARAVNLDPASSFQFQLARYRPGDLGLVPPPARRHRDMLSRTIAGSCSPITPLHRKPSSQKTASSINLSDSAARFLTPKRTVTKLK